tara:strand:+ start:164 stop:916 length:753 start_codon:yes stop_codon:yes gene_type:complete
MKDLIIPFSEEEMDRIQHNAEEEHNAMTSIVQFDVEENRPIITCFDDLGSKNMYLGILNDKFYSTKHSDLRDHISQQFVKNAKGLVKTNYVLKASNQRGALLDLSKRKAYKKLILTTDEINFKNEEILQRFDESMDLENVEPANKTWADNQAYGLSNNGFSNYRSRMRRSFISEFNRKKELWLQDGKQFAFTYYNGAQMVKYGVPVISMVIGCSGDAKEYYSTYSECIIDKNSPEWKKDYNPPLHPVIRS